MTLGSSTRGFPSFRRNDHWLVLGLKEAKQILLELMKIISTIRRICMCICMCIYIYIYIHMYLHIYICMNSRASLSIIERTAGCKEITPTLASRSFAVHVSGPGSHLLPLPVPAQSVVEGLFFVRKIHLVIDI